MVLARAADPATDPALPLRAAAAAAQAGLVLAPRTLTRLADCLPLPVPWPPEAGDALVALLGAGPATVPVWEALDQEGLVASLLPDWGGVRNRPQRTRYTYTVDRHLVEAAVRSAVLTRNVSRPDLLLLAALLHDIGKGGLGTTGSPGKWWPGTWPPGRARPVRRRAGGGIRHHLLLPQTATRRDLDDPGNVPGGYRGRRPAAARPAARAGHRGRPGHRPAAWNDWKEGLVGDLVRRVESQLAGSRRRSRCRSGQTRPRWPTRACPRPGSPAPRWPRGAGPARAALAGGWRAGLTPAGGAVGQRDLARHDGGGRLHRVAGFGDPPDAELVASDLRRALAGRLDVAERLERRMRAYREAPVPVPVAPPKVTLLDDASRTATVVEVRAHDAPGLLWRIGRALGDCGLDVRAARVETLGAEAVDVFYVVDTSGGPVGGSASAARSPPRCWPR